MNQLGSKHALLSPDFSRLLRSEARSKEVGMGRGGVGEVHTRIPPPRLLTPHICFLDQRVFINKEPINRLLKTESSRGC